MLFLPELFVNCTEKIAYVYVVSWDKLIIFRDIFSRTIEQVLVFSSERSPSVLGKKFTKCQRRNAAPPTIRHEFAATGTPLQGSAHIYPLAYVLNSPRVFVYTSDSRPSSVRIPVDQPGRMSDATSILCQVDYSKCNFRTELSSS